MPVRCALGQACGQTYRSARGREAACRPLRANWENAGRSRCRVGRGLSRPSCSRHSTLETNGFGPLSQDLCNPNYRAIRDHKRNVGTDFTTQTKRHSKLSKGKFKI